MRTKKRRPLQYYIYATYPYSFIDDWKGGMSCILYCHPRFLFNLIILTNTLNEIILLVYNF